MSVDYLLHESSVGYAIFQVVHQPDTVGNRLKEVQDSVQVGDLVVEVLNRISVCSLSLGSCQVWQDGQTHELCTLSVSALLSRLIGNWYSMELQGRCSGLGKRERSQRRHCIAIPNFFA